MNNYKISLFENSVKIPLNHLSGQELQSITNTINNFIIDEKNCDGIELSINLYDKSQDIEYGIICNANEKIISKYINKKTIINPPQYGLHSWGKVELLIEVMNKSEKKLCKEIIDKLIKDKVILDAQLEEQTERLKNIKLNKKSKKTSNDSNNIDDVSIASAKSATTSISEITTISNISLVKECSTTIRKCSKCKLPGHNITKCPMVSEKETKVSNEKKDVKVVKKCSNCKLSGHNINKCPSRNDISSNSVPDTDSEDESKISKISDEKETSVRKCSKCSTPGHTIRKCPLNII